MGRDYVSPEDIQKMAEPVLAHRIVVRGMYGRSGQGELIVAEPSPAIDRLLALSGLDKMIKIERKV